MATAPSAVTAIWAVVMRHPQPTQPPLARPGPDRGLDAHGVERAPHERQRDDEECAREHEAQGGAALRRKRHGATVSLVLAGGRLDGEGIHLNCRDVVCLRSVLRW